MPPRKSEGNGAVASESRHKTLKIPRKIPPSVPPERPQGEERGEARDGMGAAARRARTPSFPRPGSFSRTRSAVPATREAANDVPPGLLAPPRPAEGRNLDRDGGGEEVRLQDARDGAHAGAARGAVLRDVPAADGDRVRRARRRDDLVRGIPARRRHDDEAARGELRDQARHRAPASPRFGVVAERAEDDADSDRAPRARSQRNARTIASRGTRAPSPTFTRTTFARGAGETRPLARPLPAARRSVRVPCSAPVPGAPYRNGTARRPVASTQARTRRATRSGWRKNPTSRTARTGGRSAPGRHGRGSVAA